MQKEDLTGENKWNAEGHGLQDTSKGSLFQELPPVLQLHLKRFNFDYQTWTPYKVRPMRPMQAFRRTPRPAGVHACAPRDPPVRHVRLCSCIMRPPPPVTPTSANQRAQMRSHTWPMHVESGQRGNGG